MNFPGDVILLFNVLLQIWQLSNVQVIIPKGQNSFKESDGNPRACVSEWIIDRTDA